MNTLDKLKSINGYHYNWNDTMMKVKNRQGSEYGVIAQELQKEFPDLVERDTDGFLTVNYIQLIPILLQAIKELNTKVDLLSEKIN